MKRWIHSDELQGVHAAPGADGRLYITSMTFDNVSEVLEAGFVPCDPVSGKEKTRLSNRDIYDLWCEGDIDLCDEATID